MSLPPQTIQIKRKRGEGDEDQAPSYLRVEEKRRQSGNFIYQRRDLADQAKDAARPRRDLKPVIHSSKPGDELIPLDRVKAASKTPHDVQAARLGDVVPPGVVTPPTPNSAAIEPRRFHMSRSSIAPHPVISSGVSKKSRYSSPAIFVERSRKRKVVDATDLTESNGMDVDVPKQRLPKRPGADRKQAIAPQKDETKSKPSLPPSLLHRWTVNEDQFVREMEEFTLQEIGQNLARINEQSRAAAPAITQTPASPQGSKFKPKAPAKRYAERHPEVAASSEQAAKDVEMDVEDSDLDEDDYVIETYVRVPAATLGDTIPPETIGLLVFGTDQDVEFFYGNEEDSDDEWQEDEEDENAEDYYTADYPDDEVASDDEYGRDPYHYRTGNASDLEEFDEDAAYAIDDQDEPSQFRQYVGRRAPQQRSEDEDMMTL